MATEARGKIVYQFKDGARIREHEYFDGAVLGAVLYHLYNPAGRFLCEWDAADAGYLREFLNSEKENDDEG